MAGDPRLQLVESEAVGVAGSVRQLRDESYAVPGYMLAGISRLPIGEHSSSCNYKLSRAAGGV